MIGFPDSPKIDGMTPDEWLGYWVSETQYIEDKIEIEQARTEILQFRQVLNWQAERIASMRKLLIEIADDQLDRVSGGIKEQARQLI